MDAKRKPFWSRRERRLLQRWVIFAVSKKGCRTGSVAAYVQRVIKVKDLQFSPGPQQSLTPSGITENDLQGGKNCQPAQTSTTAQKPKSNEHSPPRLTITKKKKKADINWILMQKAQINDLLKTSGTGYKSAVHFCLTGEIQQSIIWTYIF